jgi:hypothetical protein
MIRFSAFSSLQLTLKRHGMRKRDAKPPLLQRYAILLPGIPPLPLVNSLFDDQEDKSKSVAVSAPWADEEVSMLVKAIAKFPGGTRNRWATIANYINITGKYHRTYVCVAGTACRLLVLDGCASFVPQGNGLYQQVASN